MTTRGEHIRRSKDRRDAKAAGVTLSTYKRLSRWARRNRYIDAGDFVGTLAWIKGFVNGRNIRLGRR